MLKLAYKVGQGHRFWEMTYYELSKALEAHGENQEYERYMTAMHASWILSAWTKRPPSAEKLLGKKKQGDFAARSEAQFAKLAAAPQAGDIVDEYGNPKMKIDKNRFRSKEEFYAFMKSKKSAKKSGSEEG